MQIQETPQDQPHSAQTITTSGLPPRRLRHAQKPLRFSLSDKRVLIGSFIVALLLLGGIVIGIMQALSSMAPSAVEQPASEQESKQAATTSPSAPAADREAKEPSTTTDPVSPDAAAVETPPTEADAIPAETDTAAPVEVKVPPADVAQQQPPSSPIQSSTNASAAAATGKPQTDDKREESSASPQSNAQTASQVIKHTVQKGDTLFSLSRRYYGNNQGWKRIASYNGLNPDDPLPIGKVLSIPSPTR